MPAVARIQVLIQHDKLHTRRAMDTQAIKLHKCLPREMVCMCRQVSNKGMPNKRAHHLWRPGIFMGEVRGSYWVAWEPWYVTASPEQMRLAVREERHAWRLVEAELRQSTMNLEEFSGARIKDITTEERPPTETVETPEAQDEPTDHPTGHRRATRKTTFAEGGRAHQELDEVEPKEERQAQGPRAPQVSDEDEPNLDRKRRIEKVSRATESEQEAARPRLGQIVGGQEIPPSMPMPPLTDSGDVHFEDPDAAIVADEVCVLLTRGHKELDLKEERWRSLAGRGMIKKGFDKKFDSLVNQTRAWVPVELEDSRRLRTAVPERILRPRPALRCGMGTTRRRSSAGARCRDLRTRTSSS